MILDIFFLIIFIYFTYKGYSKGAIVTLVSSIATFLGVLIAITFSSTVAGFLFSATDNVFLQKALPMLSYVLVFFGTVYVVRLLALFLKKTMKGVGLGSIDKWIGGLLSAATVLIIASLTYWLLTKLGILSTSVQESSKSYQFLIALAPQVIAFIQAVFPFLQSTFADLKAYFQRVQQNISYVVINR